jgi:hypothetical protein
VVIRQEELDVAFLDALAEAIDERLLARVVTKAVERLQRGRTKTTDDRKALEGERDHTATGVRHLVDAVKLRHATDTPLAELHPQEGALKALERQMPTLNGRRSADNSALAARVEAAAAKLQVMLKQGGPRARRVLQ